MIFLKVGEISTYLNADANGLKKEVSQIIWVRQRSLLKLCLWADKTQGWAATNGRAGRLKSPPIVTGGKQSLWAEYCGKRW